LAGTWFAALAIALLPFAGTSAVAQDGLRYVVQGDAISEPLTNQAGDAARGRKIVLDRSAGACVLCHALPESTERFMGNVAPSLAGVGQRLSAGQLRLRIVDGTRVRQDMAMPSYYRVDGLHEVAGAYRGKPVLTAQQVEDVIAYLLTLK
jgi:L-cysteine S-thiosulfotransferase